MPILTVDCFGRSITLDNPSSQARQRWLGEMSPEPETKQWISELPPGAVFWDIGANIGIWSVHAAVRGLRVVAIEPHPSYIQELEQTIRRNQLDLLTIQAALLDSRGAGALVRGRSKHTFKTCDPAFGIPAASLTMDMLAREIGLWPDYIKLDVDGNEHQIIAGGTEVLQRVKSMLVEIDPVVSPKLAALIEKRGFRYDRDQVAACMIREGKYAGTANYIFNRG